MTSNLLQFVHDLNRHADSNVIVKSIIRFSRGLNLRVLAEGIETQEQLSLLRKLGCDELQGYLFSEALEASAIEQLLTQDNGAFYFIKWGSVLR